MVDVSERVFRDLVGRTMEAAVDGERWPELLRELAEAGGGIGAVFVGCSFRQPSLGFLITGGLDRDLARLFVERYPDNPLSRAMLGQPLGKSIDMATLVDPHILRRTEFYQAIFAPQNARSMVQLGLPLGARLDTGGVSIAIDDRHDAASAAALLDVMAPYLQRAIVANLHLRTTIERARGLAAALDSMPSAAVVVSQDARVLFANHRAEQIIAGADGLIVVDGAIMASRSDDTRALRRLIGDAACAASGALLRGSGSIALSRRSGKGPVVVVVSPVRDLRPGDGLPPMQPMALLLVTDPEQGVGDEARAGDHLRALFGLTPMEGKVAVLVAQGHTCPETADALGVGAGTVHTHLKSIYAKTGVRHQSSLSRLLTRTGVLDLSR